MPVGAPAKTLRRTTCKRTQSIELAVEGWPIWRKQASTFTWRHAQTETCYVPRGRFVVTPEGESPRAFCRGDLIRFPAGLTCTWEIPEAVEKHYRFD